MQHVGLAIYKIKNMHKVCEISTKAHLINCLIYAQGVFCISSNNNLEIERKWLISGFPDDFLQCTHSAVVKQGYVSVNPVVRVRESVHKGGSDYVLCFKSSGILCRKEFEMPLEKQQFEELCTFLSGDLVVKEYRVYELENKEKLEVSLVDEGKDTSFYYAEVEFDSVEQAEKFVPPHFFGEEKTYDKDFCMNNYWQKTRNK